MFTDLFLSSLLLSLVRLRLSPPDGFSVSGWVIDSSTGWLADMEPATLLHRSDSDLMNYWPFNTHSIVAACG